MKKIVIALVGVMLLNSCHPKQQWRKDAIDRKEKTLLEASKRGIIDTAGVRAIIGDYESYVNDFPGDSNGAGYLFKAADFYRFMHQPNKSVQLYAHIYEEFPRSDKRPYALFLQGFIYENDIKNLDSAKVKYQQFLDAYPNHPIARDVKITMDNLGKTPEELVEGFEKK